MARNAVHPIAVSRYLNYTGIFFLTSDRPTMYTPPSQASNLYVGGAGKSMKAVELATSDKDSWRNISVALIDRRSSLPAALVL
jgi:hypothetical protein